MRHGLAGEGWDEAGFADAVSDAISRPERIAARLFGLRAEALLGGLTPDLARARLSGFLIGLELAGARPYWLGQDVVVLGAEGLAAAYLSALSAQGLGPRLIDVDAMTRAGLAVACASERTGT